MTVLNSGRPVIDEELASSQNASRDALIGQLRDGLPSDPRVQAVWLIGSLARGDQDVLSDIDLVISVAHGQETTFVRQLPAIATRFGPIAIENHVPGNAPLGGYFLGVLYDTEPLPIYVDWSIWPAPMHRPSDARVLFERHPSAFTNGPTFDEMMASAPRATDVLSIDADSDRRSRFYMLPVIAKDAVRGWIDSVEIMRQHLPFTVGEMSSTREALAELSRVVDEHAAEEPLAATSAVERYLDTVRGLIVDS